MSNEIKRKSLLTAEFFIGVSCIGALVILFYFTVVIRGKDYIFQTEKISISVQFPRAGSLAVNDKVKVIGVDIGQVKKIELAPDNNSVIVSVQLNKHKNFRLNEDYEITIQNSSVFGGAYMNIVPGIKMDSPANLNSILIGKPPVDIIMEASGLISQLKEDERKLREILIDEGFLEDLKTAVKNMEGNFKNFDQLCLDLRDGKGTLGKLLSDKELYDDLRKSLEQISNAAENANTLIADVKDGKGTLGKLAKDDEMYNSMKESLDSINTLARKVTESDGSIAKFLNDNGKLYDSVESALKNLESLSKNIDGLSKDITEGGGTIGKLMKDDSLYVEVKDTVRQIRAAVEDFREMAPIATFGSIALGAL